MNRLTLTLTFALATTALACGSDDTNLIGAGGGAEGGADEGGASMGGAAEGGSGGMIGEGGMGGSPTGSPTGTPTGSGGSDLPCAPTGPWESGWETLESDFIALVNQRRQAGGTCGNQTFGPMDAVTLDTTLRDVARAHVQDMGTGDYFAWTAPNGGSWLSQPSACAYAGTPVGGGITVGHADAQAAFDALIGDQTVCEQVHATATSIGVGHYFSETASFGHYWNFIMGNDGT
jgi:uncharacterized protein YkwD